MRRSLVLAFAILAACSGTTDSATSTTTRPPITGTAAPQALIPGALIAADPATLVPLQDAEPVVVGVSHEGVVSPNGRWAAIRTEQTEELGYRISIVDVNSLLVVADEEGSGEGLQVDDDGRAFWFEDGELRRLEITSEQTAIDAPSTPPYLADTLTVLSDGRIGYLSGPDGEQGATSVVIVDGERTTAHEIGQVAAGPVSPADSVPPHRAALVPDVAWDSASDRAIVVSAAEDLLVVVDLGTGQATEHEFVASGSPEEQSALRDSYMAVDGSTLFIASRLLDVSIDDDAREAVESPQQLVAVDTSDWTSRLVAVQAGALYPSPDGSVLATTGGELPTGSEGGAQVAQSPVFLVDTSSGEPLVGFEGRSGTIVDVQFSSEGDEMYVISEGPEGTNIDIIDVASQQLAGSLGFQRISLVGRAGLLSFHLAD